MTVTLSKAEHDTSLTLLAVSLIIKLVNEIIIIATSDTQMVEFSYLKA